VPVKSELPVFAAGCRKWNLRSVRLRRHRVWGSSAEQGLAVLPDPSAGCSQENGQPEWLAIFLEPKPERGAPESEDDASAVNC